MANITEKTSNNVFYKARCAASAHNEQLSSREAAADIMSINRGRLYRIESGVVTPYPEEIHLMADLYNAPELRNYYCTEMCALGCDMPKVTVEDLDRIVIKVISIFRKLSATEERFIDIVEDGVITAEEKPDLYKVLGILEDLDAITQSFKLWVKKKL